MTRVSERDYNVESVRSGRKMEGKENFTALVRNLLFTRKASRRRLNETLMARYENYNFFPSLSEKRERMWCAVGLKLTHAQKIFVFSDCKGYQCSGGKFLA